MEEYEVTCNEFASWDCFEDEEEECTTLNDWEWDECYEEWWREPCANEMVTDCGWIHWNDQTWEEFYVDCDEWADDCL